MEQSFIQLWKYVIRQEMVWYIEYSDIIEEVKG